MPAPAPAPAAPLEPVMIGTPSDVELSEQLLTPIWKTPKSRWWLLAFGIPALGTLMLVWLIIRTVTTGIGLWGNNIPVAWAFAIINFVWWIGIGHAGTFISAILLLFEQRWRTSINRFAEAMTLFAVLQAAIFPVLHLGRPWFAYWLIPYPATMKVWPNFKSALPWDTAAVFTYFTVSFLFWYMGLLPDLAAVRDRAPTRARRLVYGIFALGWRGSTRALRHYRVGYGLLAGLATPLVLSVHSIVSSDFATAQLPGWHSTIFPPFFVAGAIFSGFAMVITLAVPVRRAYRLHNVITLRHFDAMSKMLLCTGWIVIYSYLVEMFMAWYGGEPPERYVQFIARPTGPNAPIFWLQMACNVGVLQLLWSPRIRRSPVALFFISIAINVGMWCERAVIIIHSLEREFLPSSWRPYTPTHVDWGILIGTGCFFLLLFLLFIRFVPFVSVSECKELSHELRAEHPRGEPGDRAEWAP
jgi:Ni/Fe-hydrogenase subunit HybB-like protein